MMAAATMERRETSVLVNRVSRVLGDRRLSVKEVARKSGVSYRALLDLFHDRTTRIEFDTLSRLCEYLRVTPAELLEWVPREREALSGAQPAGSGGTHAGAESEQ